MITRVDSVMIGKKCPASYTTVDTLNAGEVALFDENRALIKDQDGALKASTIYVGVCTGDMTVTMPNGTSSTRKVVEYSNAIQKASKPSCVMGDYEAPVAEKIEIDLTSVKPVIGHRYVLRIVYKDLYEASGQFTHTYETVATSGVANDLGNALLKKINKHANRRVTAAFVNHKLTLTAMPKDDNEGVYSLEASLYVTIPGALLSNVPEAVAGATIKKTAGHPGKGFWKQVRDMEVRMLGYKGHVFTDAYPIIEPKRFVTEGATYDYFTIENDNLYLSPDNQYIKTTPLTTEVYVEHAKENKTSVFAKALGSFITGVKIP